MEIKKTDSNIPIYAWTDGVLFEQEALDQIKNVAKLPFVFKHIAIMPDVHAGKGSTIGSVIPTKGAVIPAAIGVDVGCGMTAIQTGLTISDVPETLRSNIRKVIENAIPHGRTNNGGEGDRGAWNILPTYINKSWQNELNDELEDILRKHPNIRSKHGLNSFNHLATLGTGNHFCEICLDLQDKVWVMLHSGSRGVGNRIGQYFINLAKKVCERGSQDKINEINIDSKNFFKSHEFQSMSKEDRQKAAFQRKKEDRQKKMELKKTSLPDLNLAYFEKGTREFDDYMQAIMWAQKYARLNRELMMQNAISALRDVLNKSFGIEEAISCHHNYVAQEEHFGEMIFVTRKGAIRARKGDKGIIPGSMGAKSYIVEGLGNRASFCSASHGAGRKMSRTAAKKQFTIEDHKKATEGVDCLKDASVLDETPLAYKDIDNVMEAEKDLVKPIHQLRQIICIKGADSR